MLALYFWISALALETRSSRWMPASLMASCLSALAPSRATRAFPSAVRTLVFFWMPALTTLW